MDRNTGLVADALFVGMTRPSMVWGVTYSAMMFNVVVTTESFIVTKNLAWLLAFVPMHGLPHRLWTPKRHRPSLRRGLCPSRRRWPFSSGRSRRCWTTPR
ncbi:VirB3 family type IV secretion system protein [Variovorax sp. EBFNA2]|uniref:VirB3 family type IV secretion system protein n=1 Tax=Variovorax sp. EBFNA2 TaxID=3342097 RepID=UPI0029C0F3EE|nr:VirB3 family type IV secretion system protein [Variovorax boronicumulans]WPG40951.1 VirB3 family type IV secretion system protein [Variovorax boronicumulans]